VTSPIGLEVPAAPAGQVAKHSALLAVSAGMVGVLSYLCTLLMAHLLPPEQYTQYAAAQMLVGIVGIVAHALVPLPLAALVRRHARGTGGRRDGMAFAVLVSVVAGLVAGLLTGGITAAFAPWNVALATGIGSFVLFTVAPAQGWLQGELRFTRYAVASILEVGLRLAFSAVAVLAGWGPAGALIGFAVGGLVLVAGPLQMLRDVSWHPRVLREGVRWAETGDIALVQFVVSVLVGADVVLVALLGSGTAAEAGFQALATLAKGPVYVASGTVLVAFPLLRAGGPKMLTDALAPALHSFEALALTAAVVLATVPTPLVMLVLPEKYLGSTVLLPVLAAAGLGYGAVTVLATVLLALRMTRRTYIALAAATVLLSAGLGVGWALGGVAGLATGAAAGALTATLVLALLAAPALPAGTLGSTARTVLVAAVLLVVLLLTAHLLVLWLICAAVGGLLALRPDLVRGLLHRRSRR
jgi:O-antigen/teichoic acid export membrane protein